MALRTPAAGGGSPGLNGTNGTNGTNGAAGRGISSTAIVGGHLVVTYTDSSTLDVGQVVGTNGTNGTNGSAGPVNIATTAAPIGGVIVPASGGIAIDASGNITLAKSQATAHFKTATPVSVTIGALAVLGAGIASSTDVAVPGVLLGDFVLCSFVAAPPTNITISGCQVVAANTVRVTFAATAALTLSSTAVSLNFEYSR